MQARTDFPIISQCALCAFLVGILEVIAALTSGCDQFRVLHAPKSIYCKFCLAGQKDGCSIILCCMKVLKCTLVGRSLSLCSTSSFMFKGLQALFITSMKAYKERDRNLSSAQGDQGGKALV